MATAPTGTDLLNRDFPEIRSWILQTAAALDRLDRAGADAQDDPRYDRIRRALELLLCPSTDRAEQVQLAFSRTYEPTWRKDFEID